MNNGWKIFFVGHIIGNYYFFYSDESRIIYSILFILVCGNILSNICALGARTLPNIPLGAFTFVFVIFLVLIGNGLLDYLNHFWWLRLITIIFLVIFIFLEVFRFLIILIKNCFWD